MSRLKVKTLLTGFLSLLLYVALIAPCVAASESKPQILKLTILYMNDPHGHYSSEKTADGNGMSGGFAKALSIIEEIRKSNTSEGRRTIFLLAGDLLTGTSYSTIFHGAMGVEMLNAMGLSAMVVGNHEFDYGVKNLTQNLKPKMTFPILSANIFDQSDKRLFDPYLVKRFQDNEPEVMIIGLTTADTPIISTPGNVAGLTFSDPIVAAREVLKKAPANSLVIALTHLGIKNDKLLASLCPRISIIIGGHSHTRIDEPLRVGETLVCQAGAYAEFLGRLDVDFQAGRLISYSGKLIPLGPTVKEDERILSLIVKFRKLMSPELEKPLGVNEVFLEASRSVIRSDTQNQLGWLIAGLMAKSVGADLALVNAGSIRAGLNQGVVTLNDVYSVLPFDDSVVKIDLKGSDLESLLQISAELPQGSGGKLQTFGIDFTRVDGRINILKVNGNQFNPTGTYPVAVGEFLASGGDGYTIIRDNGKNKLLSGLVIRDLLVNFIAKNKTITENSLHKLD